MRFSAVAIAVLAAVFLAFAAPVNAGDDLAFRQDIFANVQSNSRIWTNIGSVQYTAPAGGYVVVSASGQAIFNPNDIFADVYLTLTQAPAARGPWVFGLSWGSEPVQTFTIKRVFQVKGGKNVAFHLNAISINGDRRAINMETSVIAVEFYPKSDVTPQASGQAPSSEAGEAPEPMPDNVISNAP